MTIDKQAKVLLKFGSWKNYIKVVLEDSKVADDDILDEINTLYRQKAPLWAIRENWDDDLNVESFSNTGYSEDDIEYETEDEAYEQNIEDVIEELAWNMCSFYFRSDFLHSHIMEYLRYYV